MVLKATKEEIIEAGCGYIAILEAVLLPFAARAAAMRSADMNNMAAGRQLLAGGTWLMTEKGPHLMADMPLFLTAYDVLGEAKVTAYMAEQAEHVRAVADAIAESKVATPH